MPVIDSNTPQVSVSVPVPTPAAPRKPKQPTPRVTAPAPPQMSAEQAATPQPAPTPTAFILPYAPPERPKRVLRKRKLAVRRYAEYQPFLDAYGSSAERREKAMHRATGIPYPHDDTFGDKTSLVALADKLEEDGHHLLASVVRRHAGVESQPDTVPIEFGFNINRSTSARWGESSEPGGRNEVEVGSITTPEPLVRVRWERNVLPRDHQPGQDSLLHEKHYRLVANYTPEEMDAHADLLPDEESRRNLKGFLHASFPDKFPQYKPTE